MPKPQEYKPWLLAIYDLWVLGFSNRFAWRYPSSLLLQNLYNKNIGREHLDAGIGTGWFLNRARFCSDAEITLIDISPHCLRKTANKISRYQTHSIQADILKPLPPIPKQFDSIGINFLLHCLPGTLEEKLPTVLNNLGPLLKQSGVLFGSTIVGQGLRHNFLGNRIMRAYNKKGFFYNDKDSLQAIQKTLPEYFEEVKIETQGVVVTFECRKPKEVFRSAN